jgi:TatD DNase family protein
VLFDTHCHLNDEQFKDDVESVLERAHAEGVTNIVVPGVDVTSSERAILLAEKYEGVYAAVGIHPESLKDLPETELDQIRALTRHPKVVAIGEIGLDYYWDVAPRSFQQEIFAAQIALAADCGLPILIHNRDATEDTVRMVKGAPQGVHGVMHCFTGSIETALECIRKGFYISFGGPVTFKNAVGVQKTAAQVPDEWLVVETDSPYLSPHPLRGKRNEPGRVRLVAEKLAELREKEYLEIAALSMANALRLFPKIGAK